MGVSIKTQQLEPADAAGRWWEENIFVQRRNKYVIIDSALLPMWIRIYYTIVDKLSALDATNQTSFVNSHLICCAIRRDVWMTHTAFQPMSTRISKFYNFLQHAKSSAKLSSYLRRWLKTQAERNAVKKAAYDDELTPLMRNIFDIFGSQRNLFQCVFSVCGFLFCPVVRIRTRETIFFELKINNEKSTARENDNESSQRIIYCVFFASNRIDCLVLTAWFVNRYGCIEVSILAGISPQ